MQYGQQYQQPYASYGQDIVYQSIRKASNLALGFAIAGFFLFALRFGGLFFGIFSVARSKRALNAIQRYNIGHEFTGKLKFAMVLGIIDIIFATLFLFSMFS
jgi:hypothetical protein